MEAISILFIITSVVIILTPGQDMILVMSRSITQGKKAGIITALGVSIGLMGHTILATLDLGALLMTNKWLFDIIKIIGAGYLIYHWLPTILTFLIKAPIGFVSGILSFWIKVRPIVLNYINKTSGVNFNSLRNKIGIYTKD